MSHFWSDLLPQGAEHTANAVHSSDTGQNWDATSPLEPHSSRIAISPEACQLLARFVLGPDAANNRHNMSEGSSSTSGGHYSNAVPDDRDFNPYLGFIGGGFFFFTVVHYFTGYVVPAAAGATRKAQWKWRNVATSLIHSAMTGLWALLAFYRDPSMCDDMIYAFTHTAHVLVSFSIGYFLYDFFDMWLYNAKRSTYELLLHHACVVTCFAIAASTRMYLPYASLALVVEINSVFLHLRQLFIIQGYPAKSSMAYRNVALLNVATFVLFRILLLGWMTRWITVNRDNVPFVFFTAGSIGLATIITMNAVLFYRILNRDFFMGAASVSSPTAATAPNTQTLLKDQGFHPVSKDMQSMMRSLFDGESGDEAAEVVAKIATPKVKRRAKKVE